MSPFQGSPNLVVHLNQLVNPLKHKLWGSTPELDSESGLGKWKDPCFNELLVLEGLLGNTDPDEGIYYLDTVSSSFSFFPRSLQEGG